MTEAVGLPTAMGDFSGEHGIPLVPIVIVFQNNAGFTPNGQVAVDYWEDLGSPDMPVLADVDNRIRFATPYGGAALPGKCVLTPEMEILHCYTGHGHEEAFEAVLGHAS